MKRIRIFTNTYGGKTRRILAIEKRLAHIIIGVVLLVLLAVGISYAGMRCRGGFVYQGASKAEVIQKCGEPLHVDGTIISSEQVWTYNDGGIYRYLHFRGHKLDWIEDGNLVR